MRGILYFFMFLAFLGFADPWWRTPLPKKKFFLGGGDHAKMGVHPVTGLVPRAFFFAAKVELGGSSVTVAVRAGSQLGVTVTRAMSSISTQAREYERLHRGFMTVYCSVPRTADFRNGWGARSNSGISHGASYGG